VFAKVYLVAAHTKPHETCGFANPYAEVIDLCATMLAMSDTLLCSADHKQLVHAVILAELHGKRCHVRVNTLVDVVTISCTVHATDDSTNIEPKTNDMAGRA
jgi:hypothetical protein